MKTLLLLLTALPSIASTTSIAPKGLFLEKGGRVEFEAEHFYKQEKTKFKAWHITTAKSVPKVTPDDDTSHVGGASGGAYIEVLPDNSRKPKNKNDLGAGYTFIPGAVAVLSYRVKFTNTGRYYCWTRGYMTGYGQDDSIHLGIDGNWPESGNSICWVTPQGWNWSSYRDVGVFGTAYIDVKKPGIHTIQISMREDGTELDKFIFTTRLPVKGSSPDKATASGTLALAAKRPKLPHQSVPVIAADAHTREDDGSYIITANDFPRGKAYTFQQGQYLALNSKVATSADTSVRFPYSSRNYHISFTFLPDRRYGYQHDIQINGKTVLTYTAALGKSHPTGRKTTHKSKNKIRIRKGDTISVKTQIHGTNPRVADYGYWEYLRFSR